MEDSIARVKAISLLFHRTNYIHTWAARGPARRKPTELTSSERQQNDNKTTLARLTASTLATNFAGKSRALRLAGWVVRRRPPFRRQSSPNRFSRHALAFVLPTAVPLRTAKIRNRGYSHASREILCIFRSSRISAGPCRLRRLQCAFSTTTITNFCNNHSGQCQRNG